MAYRGEDLDLRLPQQRGPRDSFGQSEFGLNGTRPRTPLASGRSDPLTIDDTVMACCNHAYDIAQAHGANEVRLEHLVHALTRVEAAADILEERGIREAHLRRESAAVIASEIPVGLAHSQSAPRASAEFEDVLRRASDQAAAQGANRGASVHDLLWVLLNYNRDIPAIALLLRHAAGWQSWDWPNRRDSADPRDTVREPIRDEPRRREPTRSVERPVDRVVERRPPTRAYLPSELRDRELRERAAAPMAGYNSEALQSRLDQMEQSIRTLANEMAIDRRALGDLIRELQRDLGVNRGDGGAEVGKIVDHLRAVEANVEDRLQDLASTALTLTDRLVGLEKSVTGNLQEGTRGLAHVGERLKSLDKVMSSSSTSGLADLVTDQLVSVTEQVRQATQRLEQLERVLETRQAEGQRALTNVGERLRNLDENLAAQRREIQLSGTGQGVATLQSFVTERFQALKSHVDQSSLDLTSAVAQVIEPVVQRFNRFDDAADRRQSELQAIGPAIGQRLAGFDAALKQQFDKSQSDLGEVHDALVKLGTNQQTLAGNLEQWRLESGGDLGIISNRLELLERGSAQPLEMLAQLQTDMQGVQQVALADYDHNRRGFKQWLFGTDDVFAGVWQDETKGVRARLKQLRESTRRVERA